MFVTVGNWQMPEWLQKDNERYDSYATIRAHQKSQKRHRGGFAFDGCLAVLPSTHCTETESIST